MLVERFEVRSFRNVENVRLEPGPGTCVLHGPNAQGKTNLLEALYVLSNLQSFRTHRVGDLVPLGAASACVEGIVEGPYGRTLLTVELDAKGRRPRVNGNPPESTASYLNELPSVVFSPLDLSLARGSKELRRRYLDRATFLADSTHLTALRTYNRALKQRNAALRTNPETLPVWDEQLSAHAAVVHAGRRRTLQEMAPIVASIHGRISGRDESIEMHCLPQYGEEPSLQEGLRQHLERVRSRDERLGYTSVGPHRDAVHIKLDGRNLDEHASQGQMRTLALSMKLALLLWGQKVHGQPPLFLLDDPGSELDSARLDFLGSFLAEWPGQVLITGTERKSVPLPEHAAVTSYRVSGGRVAPD